MRSFARRHPIRLPRDRLHGDRGDLRHPFLPAGIGAIDLELPGVAPFILLSALSLVAAAFVTTALADGRAGVRALRRRVFRFRVSPGWYLVAFVLARGGPRHRVRPRGVAPLVALPEPGLLVGVALGALVAFALVNWWEEAAWTGFALHRLQGRLGPVRASVATTWMQAAPPAPRVHRGRRHRRRAAPEAIPFYLAALYILPIPVRMTLTWLYNASGRSVPIVGLYHAGLGVASGVAFLPVLAPSVDPVWVYAGFAALAAVVLVATRGRLGLAPGGRAERTNTETVMAS